MLETPPVQMYYGSEVPIDFLKENLRKAGILMSQGATEEAMSLSDRVIRFYESTPIVLRTLSEMQQTMLNQARILEEAYQIGYMALNKLKPEEAKKMNKTYKEMREWREILEQTIPKS